MPTSRTSVRLARLVLAAAVSAPVLGAPALAAAQITTSTLTGRVTANGAPLGDVTVVVTNVPTGARSGAQTREDGRFTIPNLRPGGPYRVETRRVGYRPAVQTGVFLTLGEAQRLPDLAVSQAATTLAAVTVAAAAPDAQINPDRTGPETNIDRRQVERLPTLSRSLQDLTRLTPQGNASSFAGSNFRYNNITIDGAANNDVFSFSNSYGGVSGSGPQGTPGAGSRSQPISLDAIDQVTVSVAPYDVALGNFSGASINAVTRSGTNATSGSLYTFGRNQALTGRSADDARSAIPAYHDYQIGGRLGGPIRTDRVFYFANVEVARRKEPLQFAPGDPGTAVTLAQAQQITDAYAGFLGVPAGTFNAGNQFGAYSINANSTKLFGRLDFNLSDVHKLNVRNNYVDADAGQLTRGVLAVNSASQDFVQKSRNNSTVAELRSTFPSGYANALILNASFTRDKRDPSLLVDGNPLPQVEITGAGGSSIFLGTNREAAVFRINTNQFELTDNLTKTFGRHALTLGTHNEFYKIQYNFQNAYNGRWQYPSAARFLQQQPSRVRGTYHATGPNDYATVNNLPVADFKVLWPSAYVQDEVSVSDRFRLTGGLRVDVPVFPDKPGVAQSFLATTYNGTQPFAQYDNSKIGSGHVYVAPRLSFNYDVRGDQTLQLRGGSGIFTSRIPFAWYAYAFYNNGVNFNNVDLRPAAANGQPGVVPLVSGQQLSGLQSGVYEANVIANDFKLPTVNRNSLGVDYRVLKHTTLTFEGVYTKTLQDVKFLNVGLKDSTLAGGSPVDGRPIFLGSAAQQRINPNVTSVFLLTNTTKGSRYSLTGQVAQNVGAQRFSVAYTYGQSRDVSNGIRNSPQSNWEYNQVVDPRNPGLALSNFDLRHRAVASAVFTHDWRPGFTFGVSAVYTATSGAPFSYVYNGDGNRDGSSNNDPIYVPRDFADARIVPTAADLAAGRTAQTIWADMDAFISARPELDSRRGQIAGRNLGRAPWNQQLDLRLAQDLPYRGTGGNRVQLTLDVINAGAIISKSWGRQYFVPNENNYNTYNFRVSSNASAAQGGYPNGFSFDKPADNKPYTFDPLNSRYQAQLGARVSF